MKHSSSLNKIVKNILPILKKNGVVKAGIFGSYARGEEKKGSDVDILVQPPKGSGFRFAGIELELEKKLKKKVDLLSYKGIHPLLKENILSEEIKIL